MRQVLLFSIQIAWGILPCLYAQMAPTGREDKFCAESRCTLLHTHWPLAKQSAVPDDHSRLYYARLHLQADPQEELLQGHLSAHFRITVPTSRLWLELGEGLSIDSIMSASGTLAFSREGPWLYILLPEEAPAGTSVVLEVYYRGTPEQGGGIASYTRETLKGYPIIWTLSEPYGAREWWPTRQSLAHKLDSISICITAPVRYQSVANGLLIRRDTTDGMATTCYHHSYPIPAYLVAIAVAEYSRFSLQRHLGTGDSIPEVTWVLPIDSAWVRESLAGMPDVMGLFGQLFIPYPFAREQYGHAQFGYGGGMEHTTCSFMGTFWFEIYAHELAHQWFGNQVTCGSWQDLWLNEGFATYLTGLAYEFLLPEYWQSWKQQQLDRIAPVTSGSVFVNDTTDLGRLFDGNLTYRKAGLVLHQLRWLMGDIPFFMACRNYLYNPALYYGFARTADLRRHLEAAADTSLETHFAQYVYGEGYPYWSVRWSQEPEQPLGLRLMQHTTHPSVTFFHIPVPIAVHYRTEGGILKDTLITLYPTQNHTYWPLAIPGSVEQVILDPELNLLRGATRYLNPGFQWTVYPQPAREQLHIRWGNDGQAADLLRLLDSSGRLVMTEIPDRGPGVYTLETGRLATGLYLLEAQFRGQTHRRKVLIAP
ncbi:MAG: hypothetical protein KF690_00205 [Bacteroidetes bacterium]|nr:hypothetical protein [Bacteroidota bacterium]